MRLPLLPAEVVVPRLHRLRLLLRPRPAEAVVPRPIRLLRWLRRVRRLHRLRPLVWTPWPPLPVRRGGKKVGNDTHKANKKLLEFQKRIKDAVFAALDKAQETPERAKEDERYYWKSAWRAAFVVAANMYPDDDAKTQEARQLALEAFDEFAGKDGAGADAGADMDGAGSAAGVDKDGAGAAGATGPDAEQTDASEEEEEEDVESEEEGVGEGGKSDPE